ncbi:MAG: methylenetetrahydrofolate reductase [Chloroflexi bacterium]|nr:methylenetetrahydrofolate reductase [Chloroflexota bacterium]
MPKAFELIAQVETPRGLSIEPFLKRVSNLKGKVDAIHVVEGTGGLNALVSALKIKEMGIEPVIHLYCRDKNRIALFSDLATASALGISRVVISTGHHPARTDVSSAKPVYDLDVVQTLQMVKELAEGRDLAGQSLDKPSSIEVGVMANVKGELDFELLALRKMIGLGAAFVLLTPSDEGKVEQFVSQLKVPVIGSLSLNNGLSTGLSKLSQSFRKAGASGLNVILSPGTEDKAASVFSSRR